MSECTIELPLRITVTVGGRSTTAPGYGPGVGEPSGSGLERVDIDPNYANRKGYSPEFLGTRVPLPTLTDEQRRNAARNSMAGADDDQVVLPYHHFSLVMNRRRQLAYYTAVNIDGVQSRNPKRDGDRWFFDPRIAQSEQIGEDLYARNNLDRGHLVRRLDPAWGNASEALSANNDTFHFTNCSPQHVNFNQNTETWQGIENHLLGKATQQRQRMTIFTGPVMADDDPLYRGVRLPLFFWKIAVLAKGERTLAAAAFLLDQTELVEEEIGLERFDPDTFQVQIREITDRTGLDFEYLTEHESSLERAPGLEREGGYTRLKLGSVAAIQI